MKRRDGESISSIESIESTKSMSREYREYEHASVVIELGRKEEVEKKGRKKSALKISEVGCGRQNPLIATIS